MRRLAIAALAVLVTCGLSVPPAHGRAVPHLEAGERPADECCLVYWLSGEGVTRVGPKENDLHGGCASVLVFIGSEASRPAVCIVVVDGRPGLEHRCRRVLENIRCLLGW
jgi:hypothetical protein